MIFTDRKQKDKRNLGLLAKAFLATLSLCLGLISGSYDGLQYLLLVALFPALYALAVETRPLVGGFVTAVVSATIPVVAAQGAIPISILLYAGLVIFCTLAYLVPGVVVVYISRAFGGYVGLAFLPFAWAATEFVHSNVRLWGNWANPGALGYGLYETPFM